MNQADRIRQHVKEKHIDVARKSGAKTIKIRVGDICIEIGLKNRPPAVAGALGTNMFEQFASVKTIGHEGPYLRANTVFTYELL